MDNINDRQIKNVIIVNDSAQISGGAEKVAIDSAIALSEYVKVIFFSVVGPITDELKGTNISVICLGKENILNNKNRIAAMISGIWNQSVYRQFSKLLDSVPADETIVHVHGYTKALSSSIFKACKRKNVPTILTLHDYFSVCPNGGFYNYKKDYICTVRPMSQECVLCNCDKRHFSHKIWRLIRQIPISKYVRDNDTLQMIYISRFSFSRMKEYLGEHSFHYVENPYDLGEEILYEVEKSSDYLYVGRVSEEKGADIFCEALSRLITANQIKGKAIVVGSGEIEQELRDHYPKITFTGWKSPREIAEMMKHTRALIVPSKLYECAPLTPIEFMAHGIPCIASDCCAAKDYIEETCNGFLFEHKNVKNLQEKILQLEKDTILIKMKAYLRENFVRDHYSQKNHVEKLFSVYDELHTSFAERI